MMAQEGEALGLYTAQRRGDVVRMGRQHIRNGELAVRQQKTGASLVLPVLPELQAIIDATPTGHLTFLVTRGGKSYRANNFSDQFRQWCDDAGLPPECSFHGLRKAACRRLAEGGRTVHQIAAISGHASLNEVARYTKAVDQRRLAREALLPTGEQIGTQSVEPDRVRVSKPLKALVKN
jgi:integrase